MIDYIPAKTIDEVQSAVDPHVPLRGGKDDPRYVDLSDFRGGQDLAMTIARRIQRAELAKPPQFYKQLVTGHGGCGKSTELLRLQHELEKQGYFVVYFDVEVELNLADLEYLDVLVTITEQVEAQLRTRLGVELDPKLSDDIAMWFAKVVLHREDRREVERTLETEFGLGVEFPKVLIAKMLAAIKGVLKNTSATTREWRRELEPNLTVLLNHINALIHDAQKRVTQKGKKGLVVIADGLEKIYPRQVAIGEQETRGSHELLFVDHAQHLRAPDCHIIYTVPVSMLLKVNIGRVFAYDLIPMVKIWERDGVTPADQGRQALYEVIARRVDVSGIFESPGIMREFVVASGGHVRDLLRLVWYAADLTDDRIIAAHVQQAVQRLVNDYDLLIREEDLERLAMVHRERRIPNDDAYALLRWNALVLEYQNGERWGDIHPAVQAAPTFKRAFTVHAGER